MKKVTCCNLIFECLYLFMSIGRVLSDALWTTQITDIGLDSNRTWVAWMRIGHFNPLLLNVHFQGFLIHSSWKCILMSCLHCDRNGRLGDQWSGCLCACCLCLENFDLICSHFLYYQQPRNDNLHLYVSCDAA